MSAMGTHIWKIIRENAAFFTGFALFLIAGAVLLLFLKPADDIFFFSARRSYWGNLFFIYATELGEGLFFVLAIAAMLFVRFRYALVLPLMGLVLSILSRLSKMYFSHPRPYAYLRDLDLLDRLIPVEGIHMHSGLTSFPSGHSMTGFALYGFLAFCLPRKPVAGTVFFLLALAVAVSRIYLVQHFLKDIYLGAVMGVIVALFFSALAESLSAARWPWLDRSLMRPRSQLVMEESELKEE